jgi:hypothetical protein
MSKILVIWQIFKELSKFRNRESCAIFFGQIQIKLKDGLFLEEEPDTFLVEIQFNNFAIIMAFR